MMQHPLAPLPVAAHHGHHHPLFQQLTGINIIMFYMLVLFKMLGFAYDTSLMSTVIITLVNVFATMDHLSHRKLFLQGGTQMLAC